MATLPAFVASVLPPVVMHMLEVNHNRKLRAEKGPEQDVKTETKKPEEKTDKPEETKGSNSSRRIGF